MTPDGEAGSLILLFSFTKQKGTKAFASRKKKSGGKEQLAPFSLPPPPSLRKNHKKSDTGRKMIKSSSPQVFPLPVSPYALDFLRCIFLT